LFEWLFDRPMLYYNNGSEIWILFQTHGSVYGRVLPYGVLAAGLCVMIKLLEEHTDLSIKTFEHPYAYQVFTFVVGFVLVFRCQLAYGRFWEGRDAIEIMMSNWCDAATKSVTFDSKSKRPPEDIRAFRAKIISLFSLLHATALNSLADWEKDPQHLQVLDGLDRAEVSRSLNSPDVKDRVYLIFTWVQWALAQRIDDKFGMPPPISTRLFQELTGGMLGYNQALSIHETPFPFPYAQLIALALWVLTLSCGYVMTGFVDDIYWATALTFIAVAGYHALNFVAVELEDPFGGDINDLPIQNYQNTVNNRLRQLFMLEELECASPSLSEESNSFAKLFAEPVQPAKPPTVCGPFVSETFSSSWCGARRDTAGSISTLGLAQTVEAAVALGPTPTEGFGAEAPLKESPDWMVRMCRPAYEDAGGYKPSKTDPSRPPWDVVWADSALRHRGHAATG